MQRQSGIHVFLVAPALMLWGLSRLLRTAAPEITLADSRLTLDESMTTLEATLPDVLVLDADDLPEVDSVRYAYERTRVKIVALVSRNTTEFTQLLEDAGVRATVEKRAAPASLLQTILAVSTGRPPFQHVQGSAFEPSAFVSSESAPLLHAASIESLTGRERQVISAVTADPGAPLKVVADRIHISEHTLRNQLTTIYGKLGLAGRVHLHDFAARNSLIAGEPDSRVGWNLSLW